MRVVSDRSAHALEVIVRCAPFISANKLAVQPVEFPANASIHGVLEHSTKFDEPDNGPVFRRQRHLSHWVDVIKIHYINASLIVTPEDAGRQGDARHCRSEACCPAVQPDLEYRRSDREEGDR